ncbi:hypothetical protein [Halobacillus karajensis]|uniref:hypothetical protein n=1 Tax=Halobacillus karajensis TaxID=195088 RepID=UPI00045C5571|nr:hypothetical protein [Halobacillus karajensis]CDQ21694.1 hypothetical protein BN982_04103 [Halobacillus karajensis]
MLDKLRYFDDDERPYLPIEDVYKTLITDLLISASRVSKEHYERVQDDLRNQINHACMTKEMNFDIFTIYMKALEVVDTKYETLIKHGIDEYKTAKEMISQSNYKIEKRIKELEFEESVKQGKHLRLAK